MTKMLLAVYAITSILCQALQHSEMDIVTAKNLTEATITQLISLNCDETFNEIFKSAVDICKSVGISCPSENAGEIEINKPPPRKRGRFTADELQREIEHNHETNNNIDNFATFRGIFYTLIQTYIEELDSRFTNPSFDPLFALHKVITAKSMTEFVPFEKNLEIYKNDINLKSLKSELPLFIAFKENNRFDWDKLSILRKEFINNKLHICFPNIYIAMQIYFSFPVSSAEAERSFSCLRLLKTHLRTTMMESRLSSLALLQIESEFTRDLDLEKLVDKFASVKNRRLAFF
jgi:Leucine-rich repeat (LRR) protein